MSDPDNHVFTKSLRAALTSLSVRVTDEQIELFLHHYRAMVEANRSFNLTRITDPGQAAVRHYADSLAVVAWAQQRGLMPTTVLDVGTGAGFPAVPLAVTRPDWEITAIDGTRRKTDFVARTAAELGLVNLRPIHAHADHWNTDERFDLILARALAPLDRSLPIAAKFLRPGGHFAAFKGRTLDPDERRRVDAALMTTGLEEEDEYLYDLPEGGNVLTRGLFTFRRVASAR